MYPTVYIAMFGWIPVALGIFMSLPARRALIASSITAWLFLPVATFSFHGFPDYTKNFATCFAALLGLLVFDQRNRLWSFRMRWFDLPMLVWCLCPMVSSLTNGMGVYDGFSSCFDQFFTWGLPYLFGRVYLGTPEGLRDLARGVIIGGLVYVPLCLYEIRMSPQLHVMFYGFRQHSFIQTVRFGGWRPMVFLQHGLAVGMWMATASLVALVLRRSRSVGNVAGIPIGLAAVGLGVTTILCKSLGALFWLSIGIGVHFLARRIKVKPLLLVLISIAPCYLTARLAFDWAGEEAVAWTNNISEDRSGSLQFRLANEELLKRRALERPFFGWSRWGGSRIKDQRGNDISITDSLWIIALGDFGLVGLAAIYTVLLAPALKVMRRLPPRGWTDASTAHIPCLAVCVILYVLDSLLNANFNPVFMLMAGGVMTAPMALGGGERRTGLSAPTPANRSLDASGAR